MVALLFILLFVFFLINMPIGIALGLASLIFFVFSDQFSLAIVTQKMFSTLDSFPLLAAPFFILAGKLMEHGGISQRIIDFAKVLVGHFKGGLAHVAIFSCMIFAALTGSASATTAAIGAIMISAMVKEGYDRNFAAAVVAGGGTVGIVIPPSVPLILYGVSAGASISDLFIAGIMPGIMIGASLMIVAYVISRVKNYGVSKSITPFKEIMVAFRKSILAIIMPVIILGGIYGGIFTPTEASVVAVVYGLVIGAFIYRELKWSVIRKILLESSIVSAVILLIISTASLFGVILTRERLPQTVANLFIESDLSPIIILLLINLLLILVGTFLETIASILILTPILMPVVNSLGIDPVHFGIIMIVNLSLGFITPPVGVNLFVAAQVGSTKYEKVVKAIFPFIIIMIVNILIITFVPSISIGLIKE